MTKPLMNCMKSIAAATRVSYTQTNTLLTACLLMLAFLAMPAIAADQPQKLDLTEDQVAGMVIPKMHQAPVIDGTIDDKEWQQASAISGTAYWNSNVLAPRPSTFYLGWDEGHLYMACRLYLQPNYKPSVPTGRSQGLAYIWDDGLELHFKPMGKNVGDRTNSSYKLFLNALGFTGDHTHLALGQQFKSWAPNFKIATRVTEPGTAPNGGSWWEMELSSVPEDFVLTGKHKTGDQWKFLFGVNHFPAFFQARIPATGSYLDPFGYGTYTLVDDAPAVQMHMTDLNNLATTGDTALALNMHNATNKQVDLTVDLNVADIIKSDETITLKPGESRQFKVDQKLADDQTTGLLSLKVTQDKGKNTQQLLRYVVSFNRGAYAHTIRSPKPREEGTFAYEVELNPVKSTVLVRGDTYELPDPATADHLLYEIRAENSDKVMTSGRLTNIAEWYFRDIIQLPPLAPGKYVVASTMVLKDGTKLGPMEKTIEKLDEAKAFPQWWGKNFGNTERVIYPFTAMTNKGNQVGVNGRSYELNAIGLPVSMTAAGEKVSSGNARLVVVVDGKEHDIDLSGKPTITKAVDWRVSFKGQASGAGLDITSEGWVEQDGLCFITLSYAPQNNKTVNVQAMRIEYPLSPKDAESLVCVGPGANYSTRTTKLLDLQAKGRLWSSHETGITGSGMTVGSFYPTVWVGNDRRGMLWWADNDKGWVPETDVPAHEVIRRGDSVVLINHIIGSDFKLQSKRAIEFGYMATPLRPLPDGWRTTISSENGTFYGPWKDKRIKDSQTDKPLIVGAGHVNWSHPASRYPEEWPAMYAEYKATADKAVHRQQWTNPYKSRTGFQFQHNSWQLMGYGNKSIEKDVWNYFGQEWIAARNETWNQSATDYLMFLINDMMKQGGLRTTYWDLTFPILSDSLLSGLAYRLPDGRIQRGYNGFNIRRFFMRLQSMAQDYDLVPGAVGVHSTNAYVTIAMPWVDAVLDGERDWDLDTSPHDWVDNMPIERMRSLSVVHNWGVPIAWMSNFNSTGEDRKAKRRAAQIVQGEYVWMYDSWLNPYIHPRRDMPEPVLDWGINETKVVYHPFWRQKFVKTDNPDILVSVWQLPDRVMLGVYNYNAKKSISPKLEIDLDALGLVPQRQWQDFVRVRDLYDRNPEKIRGTRLDFHERTLKLDRLDPHAIRLIGVRKY